MHHSPSLSHDTHGAQMDEVLDSQTGHRLCWKSKLVFSLKGQSNDYERHMQRWTMTAMLILRHTVQYSTSTPQAANNIKDINCWAVTTKAESFGFMVILGEHDGSLQYSSDFCSIIMWDPDTLRQKLNFRSLIRQMAARNNCYFI